MIDDLIAKISSQLGVDAGTASKALGLVFAFLKKEGDGDLVSELFSKMQGADALAEQESDEIGGGLLGGLANAAGGLLGDKASGAIEAMSILQKSGLSMDQAKSMAPMVADYARQYAGDDLMKKALASAPALKSLFNI